MERVLLYFDIGEELRLKRRADCVRYFVHDIKILHHVTLRSVMVVR
mgnify:CR=1 FL=1